MRLGSCLYEGREFESAKDCYERVLTIDPSNDLALDNMVACKNKLIEPDAPKPTQDPGVQADNIPSDKLHSLLEDAEFFNNSGNPDSTAETLEEAVTLAPNETVIVSALGGVYFKLGKYQKAREMFRKEIELTPAVPMPIQDWRCRLYRPVKLMSSNPQLVLHWKLILNTRKPFVFSPK